MQRAYYPHCVLTVPRVAGGAEVGSISLWIKQMESMRMIQALHPCPTICRIEEMEDRPKWGTDMSGSSF